MRSSVNPLHYFRKLRNINSNLISRWVPNSLQFAPAGHFYSPLLDRRAIAPDDTFYGADGVEFWEHINLRKEEQLSFYTDIQKILPKIQFPKKQVETSRYYSDNCMFALSDALTLSSIIRLTSPSKIIEIGSGFSSAVMLDTLDNSDTSTQITFIEPFPDRLNALLTSRDHNRTNLINTPVQQVDISLFDELDANDILFVDSSHVAKVGSDVSFLLLRVLPRLRAGVIVHFHDVFYPFSYPIDWIREGRAWNESLFLRAFLVGNSDYEIVAFNSFAAFTFPELFRTHCPEFLENSGGSIWLRKIA